MHNKNPAENVRFLFPKTIYNCGPIRRIGAFFFLTTFDRITFIVREIPVQQYNNIRERRSR